MDPREPILRAALTAIGFRQVLHPHSQLHTRGRWLRHALPVTALLSVLGLTASLSPQVAWKQQNVAYPGAPSARGYTAMAYDDALHQTVLFGGGDGAGAGNDTWEWDGVTWHLLAPAVSPPPQYLHAMTYDALRNRVVLRGGLSPLPPYAISSTWEFDGKTWIQSEAYGSPTLHPLAYDLTRNRVVAISSAPRGTWQWTGTTWQQITATAPPPLNSAMASDGNGIILFGGVQLGTGLTNQTWRWDGSQWTLLSPPSPLPPPRVGHSLVWDPYRNRLMLFGGNGSHGPLNDTWEWDGAIWHERFPLSRPPARLYHAAARDPLGGQIVFGGFLGSSSGIGSNPVGDTWTYTTTAPASYSVFGQGCSGMAGTPMIQLQGSNFPWIGDVLSVVVAPIAYGAPTAMVLGNSAQAFNGLSLPLSLASVGMPGCNLYVGPDLALPATVAGATATWSLPIPNAPILVGRPFYNQAFVLDYAANALGLICSCGAVARIGAR